MVIVKTLPHTDYLSRLFSAGYGWNWNKMPEQVKAIFRRNTKNLNLILSREMANKPELLRQVNELTETGK